MNTKTRKRIRRMSANFERQFCKLKEDRQKLLRELQRANERLLGAAVADFFSLHLREFQTKADQQGGTNDPA